MSTALATRRIPGLALARRPRAGHKLVDLRSFGFALDLSGADSHGYNQSDDVLVTESLDGIDYNAMYAEFQATLALQNAERTAIVDFLTFTVTNPTESVSQLSGAKFEKATEYGEPRGVRQKPNTFWMGYTFDQFDIAIRYTWQFLANATAAQVEGLHGSVIEADNQLLFEETLKALYNNSNREADINDQPYNVYALYNADNTVPPSYKSNTFDGTHTHYVVSGAATIDSGDLDTLIHLLSEHGYNRTNGVQMAICMNSREGTVVRTFRIANGDTYDFIPSKAEATPLILDPGQEISGGQPASFYRGLNVIGSYGEALLIEDDNFPPGYVINVGTGGKAALQNPVGIREHQNASQRGLRLIKGPDNAYPLTDSYYMRAFGTGIRQRGGAAVMQIKANGSYAPPTQYLYD